MFKYKLLVVVMVLLFSIACGNNAPTNTTASPAPPPASISEVPATLPGVQANAGQQIQTTSSGLKYIDLIEGTGQEAKKGNVVTVNYTGWLNNGKKFDSSVDAGQPFPFNLGAGQVIEGWDEGVAGMKVGGKRKLIIPSALGYGPRGAGRDIPPNALLIFDVELLAVK
jgi:FKBP-type peptidyl-prolyl cis-trans isomerase